MKNHETGVREERVFKERYKVSNVSALLADADVDTKVDAGVKEEPVSVVDVNPYGALLHGEHPVRAKVLARFIHLKETVFENRRAYCDGVTRKGADGSDYTPLIFDPPLSMHDMKELGVPITATKENNPGLWNLLQQDIIDLGKEIQAIERCRSDIFLAIVTSIFLVAVTIGCMAVTQVIHLKALCLGGGFTFAMFLLGAFTTVEKAKVLNMRRALYVILCNYIKQNWLPVTYQGWFNMKYIFLNCGIRRKLGICSRRVPDKAEQKKHEKERKEKQNISNLPDENSESCLYLGEWQAKPINEARNFMPGITDSFMSTCSYVYAALYVFTIISTGVIAYQFLKKIPEFTIVRWHVWWLVSYVAGIAISLVCLFKYRKLISIIFGTILSITVLGYASFDITIPKYGFISGVLLGFTGFFIGAVGSFLLHNLYALRQGKDSYDTYYFAWKKAIEYCNGVCEQKLQDKEIKVSRWQKFLNKIVRS